MTDWGSVVERITTFIKDCVSSAGAKGVVVGVSGGVDSACVAKLCTMALGSDSVLALIMPEEGVTPKEDVEDAVNLCKELGVEYRIIEINPFVNAFVSKLGEEHKIAVANIKPRIRMILLYFHANSRRLLVAGTGNKSELMAGYFTKYGDGGVDFLPIGDLYKTEVFQLARYLGIPERIVTKKPSARLWKGQTDEEEMGISYEKLDAILKAMEKGVSVEEIPAVAGVSEEEVATVVRMVELSRHKREPLPLARVRDLLDC
ncbi:NAD+ synthase [Archaeoglobus veneficus]|uniref:NH(3)-dependent NAD(+) synthetase n=1 Tax=Archaeoglobus veneficus (strain DSM 11195 / SNP6) TaxID=693661 RepID=F2KNR0_ARCVS|nr:NAD+ synthase [Archaeoglobus veneficus]AEA47387.1 NH(3)-dependent NAD(+) synthetase [Archaeoglobus veneficus SNP6]